MRYLTSGIICKELQITPTTLMNWKNSGKIKYKKLSDKKILYDIDSIVNQNSNSISKRVVIYSRVSNTKQKEDLIRQAELLRKYVVSRGDIVASEFSDIASGMNENRKGLNQLVDLVHNCQIDEIVITYKDRLTRFGFSYFESWFSRFGVQITVVNATKEEDFQQELTQDLISIIHHFSMKMYSNRRRIAKQFKEQLKTEDLQTENP